MALLLHSLSERLHTPRSPSTTTTRLSLPVRLTSCPTATCRRDGTMRTATWSWGRLRTSGALRETISRVAREKEFTPTEDNCPVPLRCLARQRITKLANGQVVRDKWTRGTPCRQLTGHTWTGYTRFKIQTPHRKDAKNTFQDKSFGAETIYLQEDKTNAPLSERTMSLSDRLAFKEAKQKELASFFRTTSGSSTRRPMPDLTASCGQSSSSTGRPMLMGALEQKRGSYVKGSKTRML